MHRKLVDLADKIRDELPTEQYNPDSRWGEFKKIMLRLSDATNESLSERSLVAYGEQLLKWMAIPKEEPGLYLWLAADAFVRQDESGRFPTIANLDRLARECQEGEEAKTSPTLIAESESVPAALEVVDGGYTMGVRVFNLVGRPHDALAALMGSPLFRMSVGNLVRAMNINEENDNNPDEIVKNAVKELRASLRAACSECGIVCKDPIASIGRGASLTYEIASVLRPKHHSSVSRPVTHFVEQEHSRKIVID